MLMRRCEFENCEEPVQVTHFRIWSEDLYHKAYCRNHALQPAVVNSWFKAMHQSSLDFLKGV